MKKGKFTQNGVHLQDHEYNTVKFFLDLGYDVELIPPIQIKGVDNPDMVIDGLVWEMKSPAGGGKHTIKKNVQRAKHQSNHIIVDLRRCKLTDKQAVEELERHFQLSKRLRRMRVITKEENLLDYKK